MWCGIEYGLKKLSISALTNFKALIVDVPLSLHTRNSIIVSIIGYAGTIRHRFINIRIPFFVFLRNSHSGPLSKRSKKSLIYCILLYNAKRVGNSESWPWKRLGIGEKESEIIRDEINSTLILFIINTDKTK